MIVVQKFGGSSLSNAEARKKVINKIINSKKKNNDVVVVVSAIGREPYPYATDSLLKLISSNDVKVGLKEKDEIMSMGEIISANVLVGTLRKKGYNAEAIFRNKIGIKTDNNFSNAAIIGTDMSYIKEILKQGKIPVIAGFQGVNENGETTTLGRGGSDTTASIVGKAINADVVEIYSDIDGVYSIDPKKISNAKLYKEMSYMDLLDMAEEGAKLIHKNAMKIAMDNNIPLVLKNTYNNKKGTVVNKDITNKKKAYAIVTNDNEIIIFGKLNKEITSILKNYKAVKDNNKTRIKVDDNQKMELIKLINDIIIKS